MFGSVQNKTIFFLNNLLDFFVFGLLAASKHYNKNICIEFSLSFIIVQRGKVFHNSIQIGQMHPSTSRNWCRIKFYPFIILFLYALLNIKSTRLPTLRPRCSLRPLKVHGVWHMSFDRSWCQQTEILCEKLWKKSSFGENFFISYQLQKGKMFYL